MRGPSLAARLSRPVSRGPSLAARLSRPVSRSPPLAGRLSRPVSRGPPHAARLSQPASRGPPLAARLSRPISRGPSLAAHLSRPVSRGPFRTHQRWCRVVLIACTYTAGGRGASDPDTRPGRGGGGGRARGAGDGAETGNAGVQGALGSLLGYPPYLTDRVFMVLVRDERYGTREALLWTGRLCGLDPPYLTDRVFMVLGLGVAPLSDSMYACYPRYRFDAPSAARSDNMYACA